MSQNTVEVGLTAGAFARPRRSLLSAGWNLAKRKPLGAVSAAAVAFLIFLAVAAPLVAPYDPLELRPRERLQAPSASYLAGTDQVGRDVLSRLIYGARVSIWVGIVSVLLGAGVGTIIGLISGYFGGMFDLIFQRLVDTAMAFPALILALVIVTVLGPGLTNMLLAVAFVVAPGDSRIVRSAVLAIKENTYIDAARAIGVGHPRMITRHILPNVMAPIIVIFSLLFATAILIEASLSFLGLGVQPPTPSWGNMLSAEGRRYMELAPWLAIFPGVCISICVLAFNLTGDTLRDILDPRLRGT